MPDVSYGFVTAEEVATSLGMDATSSVEIDAINEALLFIEDEIQLYCDTSFVREDNTSKIYDGSGLTIQSLGLFVRNIDKIYLLDTTGARAGELTDAVLRPNPCKTQDASGADLFTWIERRQYEGNAPITFPKGLANIEIVGDWGMVDVPYPIKRDIVHCVKYYFDMRNYDATKTLETGFGRTATFQEADRMGYIPPVAKRLLSKYRYRSFAE